ncbi:AIG2-like family protein [Candidatus Methylomirabilis lanthanidiphila]|uniref:AIG2-like family protein n=1 Tax=Candidatus Methylomirabilis lanthanidiphila TaxID=2211376 RepID=A0A564ZJ87_9BACT|nr:gamma-glutamylcyclotransferase [Candidatus Methylomirabilis lanthanidiphila]VUZ85166.1 AIG2-like family protein [Candidatus Methylomirabilis lanthanidiphila]
MFYFAYGSNMERVQLKRLCPTAKFVAAATLADCELTFSGNSPMWGGGIADIRERPGKTVEGVVWEISEADRKVLDGYEGYPALYLHKEIQVSSREGKTIRAFAYSMANPGREMSPSKRYKQLLIAGAEEHGLSDEYIDFLESIRPLT